MNLSVTNFWCGICFCFTPPSLSSGGKLANSNVTNNDYGINLEYASNMEVSMNFVSTNSEVGITLYYSTDNEVLANNITGNSCGIQIACSSNNRLRSNNMTHNSNNFRIDGIYPLDFVNDVDISNTVNNKPIYYWIKESGPVAPLDAGCVVLVNCTGITAKNLTLTEDNVGIFLAYTMHSEINLNTIENSSLGIRFISSFYNNVSQNRIMNSDGILFSLSSNNTINGNDIARCGTGIEIDGSSYNNVSGNFLSTMEFGIDFESSHNSSIIGNNFARVNGWSIEMWSSYNNKICKNDFTGNETGAILVYDSEKNLIEENDLTNISYGIGMSLSSNNSVNGNQLLGCTHYGVWLYSSSNNLFYYNNFINNTQQVSSDGSPNTWDNGYPSGGNYWSNYTGVDLNPIDGIGDTPYNVDVNNIDNYPLMAPIKSFDAGTWNNTSYNVDMISNSTLSNFSFNATAKTICFNVTGTSGTIGFCRVAIPKALMSCTNPEDWIVTINGTRLLPPNLNVTTYADYTYIYFNYTHSAEQVQIQSTSVVPEFQPYVLMPIFMIITLIGAIILKRRPNVKK